MHAPEAHTIAVIEDNPDNLVLVRAMLEDHYTIHEYASGPDALAGMRRQRPDLVLLDISLPGMDGSEVLGNLRRQKDLASLPVIAVTAHAMAGDRERYIARGFDEYLTKPIVDESELLTAIARLLSKRADGRGE